MTLEGKTDTDQLQQHAVGVATGYIISCRTLVECPVYWSRCNPEGQESLCSHKGHWSCCLLKKYKMQVHIKKVKLQVNFMHGGSTESTSPYNSSQLTE